MTSSTSAGPHKSLLLAFILGLLLPGLGLFYAAPWAVAGLATVIALVFVKLVGWVPLLGKLLVGGLGLLSGALGLLYARAYNRQGKRAAAVTSVSR